MKNSLKTISVFLALIAVVLCAVSCSKLLAPTDDEIIKAIMDHDFFKKYSLKSPIVIVKKSDRDKDGYWHVEVKYSFTWTKSDGQQAPLMENTSIFKIRRDSDSSGAKVWKAQVSSE